MKLDGSVVVERVEPTHRDRALVQAKGTLKHRAETVMTGYFDVYVRRVPS